MDASSSRSSLSFNLEPLALPLEAALSSVFFFFFLDEAVVYESGALLLVAFVAGGNFLSDSAALKAF